MKDEQARRFPEGFKRPDKGKGTKGKDSKGKGKGKKGKDSKGPALAATGEPEPQPSPHKDQYLEQPTPSRRQRRAAAKSAIKPAA